MRCPWSSLSIVVTPMWFKHKGCAITCKCYLGKNNCAYPGDSTFELLLLAKYMSSIHWGCHVEVPNSNSISWSNSSLLECSPAVQGVMDSNLGCSSEEWRWPWPSLSIVVTPTWFKHRDFQVPFLFKCKCYSGKSNYMLILVILHYFAPCGV
jgi:hypothetical protein